jgi:hypothetical protein
MAELVWDQVGERTYETGVDHGVLYLPDNGGAYADGVAWNGLTGVTESPSGAEPSAQYADNIKYLNLFSAEEFGATIEAFTYPDEFAQFDGLATPTAGVAIGQQSRRTFGLSYRTRLGNDIEGDDYGYKLHLIYGAMASPSEKAYTTINAIKSTEVDADALAALEDLLYGTAGTDPSLPLPAAVIALFSGTVTEVNPAVPTYNDATDTITIPVTAGVTYYINGEAVSAGPVVITEDTVVEARADDGYSLPDNVDTDWGYDYTP